MTLPVGRAVVVTAPATSANLGPGFDAFGLGLDWSDTCSAVVVDGPARAEVTGEGAERMPTDGRHLVLRCADLGLASLGHRTPSLALRAHNTIPHSRGLGSSSAAIVSGLGIAWGLARPGTPPDLAWMAQLAADIEGHPDNVAAAVHGGFVIAYRELDSIHVVGVEVHPDVSAVVYVPRNAVSTAAARRLLPASVPHAEAAANSGRSALLVLALGRRPDLLATATRDWLHTDYRRTVMPESHELLCRLRAAGHAAVVSGAGPSVLVLGVPGQLAALPAEVPGFARRAVGVGVGVRVRTTPDPDDRAISDDGNPRRPDRC